VENNKLIIGIIVGIVAFFAAPIVVQKLRQQQTPAVPAAAAKPGASAAAPGFPAAPGAVAPGQAPAPAPIPGGLTAQTLVGTMWEVSSSQGTIKFQFNAGGQGVGMHVLLGQLPATWICSGNQVNVTATVMGRQQTISAQIQGNNLVGQGCTIRRLQ
jgi:hypothetical protein